MASGSVGNISFTVLGSNGRPVSTDKSTVANAWAWGKSKDAFKEYAEKYEQLFGTVPKSDILNGPSPFEPVSLRWKDLADDPLLATLSSEAVDVLQRRMMRHNFTLTLAVSVRTHFTVFGTQPCRMYYPNICDSDTLHISHWDALLEGMEQERNEVDVTFPDGSVQKKWATGFFYIRGGKGTGATPSAAIVEADMNHDLSRIDLQL